ncbi:MAG TPA: efflux RND transporter periplasmic adaptor subunit [Pirellula sp.]|nr:efflux RND transporter periplasmic adaptor subunit [Pirellula sp.]
MKRRLLVLLLVTVVVGSLVASRFLTQPVKISGFIEADEVRVGSRVGGRVSEVLVREGQQITRGQLLLRLQPYDLQLRLAEACSQLAAREAVLAKLKAGLRPEEVAQRQARVNRLTAMVAKLVAGPREEEVAAARARLTLSMAQRDRAKRSYERIQALYSRDATSVSREELDRVLEDSQVAEATHQVRQEELQLLERGTRDEEKAEARAQLEEAAQGLAMAKSGFRAEEIAEAAATVNAAQAAVDAIKIQLNELEVLSDVNGVVEALELRPGDLVGPNAPLLSLLDTSRIWVRAYVPENRLNVRIGDRFWVTVDSFPNRDFQGTVTYISNQAEFTPRNVQTPDERSRQVFRIKVELSDDALELRPGMAADVWLDRPLPQK